MLGVGCLSKESKPHMLNVASCIRRSRWSRTDAFTLRVSRQKCGVLAKLYVHLACVALLSNYVGCRDAGAIRYPVELPRGLQALQALQTYRHCCAMLHKLRSPGVVVITSALHAAGRQFDPGGLHVFTSFAVRDT